MTRKTLKSNITLQRQPGVWVPRDSCDRNLLRIKEDLTFDMKNILLWFRINSLKANAGKFQFMILNRKNHRRQRMVINSITVKESNEVILLGITIDNKLVFKNILRIYVEQLNISSML